MSKAGVESELYKVAEARLLDMEFFGIFDRLTESYELLAYTFCWNWEETMFTDRGLTRHDKRGTALDNISRKEVDRIKMRNSLDVALFELAERVFDERLANMRYEKAQGYRCRLPKSDCALVCLPE